MSREALIAKIEALPPEKKAEVERFVEALSAVARQGFPRDLLEQINASREAVFREHGPIETDSILRDLRNNGGR